LFFCLQIINFTFFIFKNIFGQTCYGVTVGLTYSKYGHALLWWIVMWYINLQFSSQKQNNQSKWDSRWSKSFLRGICNVIYLGASTVKWTALDPCSGLSESDPKQYTNFKFYEIKIHKHLENIWIYKAKQFMFTKNNFKQRICILEDGASGGASGCHWKDNCQKLV
jgi:hypothetical protein